MNVKATIAATAIASLLVGGGIGFVSARTFGRQLRTFNGTQRPANGTFRGPQGQGGPMGGGRVIGSVQSIQDGRLTIQTPNNSSQIILTNNSTTYQKSTAAASDDIAQGTQVIVSGQRNPDGSTTATTIQIAPTTQQ